MGLNKSKGNMYDWVTHTWSPIIGCSHQCQYCYVKAYRDQPPKAEIREDFPRFGEDKTIFVGHLCDMFSEETPIAMIKRVIEHCNKFPKNTFVFQTKNPMRLYDLINNGSLSLPDNSIIGTTIETNREDVLASISTAPPPSDRAKYLSMLNFPRFVTIEPILDFDVEEFAALIDDAIPKFVNIGADSKKNNLEEPTREKVMELVEALRIRKITIRKKVNLDRLLSTSTKAQSKATQVEKPEDLLAKIKAFNEMKHTQ